MVPRTPAPAARSAAAALAVAGALTLGLAGHPAVAFARAPTAKEAANSDAARLAAAEARATEAKALFRNKVYPQAARMFMEAFATSRRASLVYNAARAYEEGAMLKRAESLFLMYLSLPDADDAGRADANAHLADVRARIARGEGIEDSEGDAAGADANKATDAAAVEPAASATAPAPAQASRWPLYTGAALALAGGVVYGVAYRDAAGLDLGAVRSDADANAYAADRDRVSAMRWAAAGVGTVGAALIVYGLLRSAPPGPSSADSVDAADGSTWRLLPALVGARGVALHLRF